jgi:hypothetical protein
VNEKGRLFFLILKVPTRAAQVLHCLARHMLHSARHLKRRAACEGEEQEALRVYALHEVRHAARECVGLAGAGLGEDQQGPSPKQVAARWRGFSFSNWARACTGPDYRTLLYILQFYV